MNFLHLEPPTQNFTKICQKFLQFFFLKLFFTLVHFSKIVSPKNFPKILNFFLTKLFIETSITSSYIFFLEFSPNFLNFLNNLYHPDSPSGE